MKPWEAALRSEAGWWVHDICRFVQLFSAARTSSPGVNEMHVTGSRSLDDRRERGADLEERL